MNAAVGDLPPIVGVSAAIQQVRHLIARFAPTRIPVLLLGPTGVGKDLVARHIHVASSRRGPWVPVNCGLLPREMAGSLLFGHRRGSFSGAVESRTGHVVRSASGTLFLDEVLSLPEETQVQLLRALEGGEIQPLGEDSYQQVDLRVVAALQDDAGERLATGAFRRDLFRRLAGVVVEIPALAQRIEDVMPLARFFAEQGARTLESTAERVLLGHPWPDNVRELRHAIERAACLVSNGSLSSAAIAEAIHLGTAPERCSLRHDPTQQRLVKICEANDFDAVRVAASLGVSRSTVYHRLHAVGLSLRVLRQSRLSRNSAGSIGRKQNEQL